MADETYADHSIKRIIDADPLGVAANYIVSRPLNGAAYAGDVLTGTGETAPDLDQAEDGEVPFGICLGPSTPADSYALDDQIADNTMVDVLLIGAPRVEVYLKREAPSATNTIPGTIMTCGTEGGKVRKIKADTDASSYNDIASYVGRIVEYCASSADDQIILVRLGA